MGLERFLLEGEKSKTRKKEEEDKLAAWVLNFGSELNFVGQLEKDSLWVSYQIGQ